jgi:quinol-cytochrome oxidoreductase complex cytochrome b subunit
MGVVLILLTFLSLICLPFFSSIHIGSPKIRIIYERIFWVFVANVFLLTMVGAQEIMPATVLLGQVCTIVLFMYLWLVYPFVSLLESTLYLSTTNKHININKH